MGAIRAPLLVVVLLVGSGCAGRAGPAAAPSVSATPEDYAPLMGFVLDPGIEPVVGASVGVHGTNATTRTDAGGGYRFAEVPFDVPLVVIVEAEGFLTASKSATVPMDASILLNFTLEPVPVRRPYHQVLPMAGFLSCQAFAAAAGGTRHLECGGFDSNNKPIHDFAVGPDTAGVVLELVWEPGTAAAESLNVTVETVNFGDQDQVLATAVGASVLRTQVSELQARRFYSSGGIMRAIVAAGVDPDEYEGSAGASVPVQQAFTLYASVFYVEPPPPTYTAIEE